MEPALLDQAFEHHKEGRLAEAERLYRAALASDAHNFQALQLLGTLTLRSNRNDEAIILLQQALTVLDKNGEAAACHAFLYNNLGIAMRIAKRSAEAADYFREGLKLDPNLIELYVSLGGVLMELGDYAAAAGNLESAVRLNPNLPGCLCDLGTIYARGGKLEEAIDLYRRTLALNPLHWAARINLAQMLRRTGQHDEATVILTTLLQEKPDNLSIHSQLGVTYAASQDFDRALDHFRRVLAQKPDDAEALQYIANILQTRGQTEEADEKYRRSLALRPLITIEATRSPPDFSVLLLFAPGAGNTPLDCLVDRAEHENNILNLLPGADYDIAMLRRRADIVVNLIADVDQSRPMLEPAAQLVERIGKPVINHPRAIMRTDRQSIATILAGAPGCVVPKAQRMKGLDLLVTDFTGPQAAFSFPFLARRTGTHGGIDFEKVHNEAELQAFVSRCPDAEYYLTEYVDYRSADGYFRKYRFIFVDGDVLPYHLAIDDKWKIHHVTTDMENQTWMQREEQDFLENPHKYFGPRQYDALRAIQSRIGLDYFGIDCGLDCEARVVMFEANACMLVHQHNEKFPYKACAVRRIKMAFDAMLKRRTNIEMRQAAC